MRRIIILLTMVGLLAACDPAEQLCFSEHPHKGRLMLAWDWPTSSIAGSEENNQNEQVAVFAVRTVNMIKYAGLMNRPPRGQYSSYICRTLPISQASYDENWHLSEVDNVMREGTYDLLSFNSQRESFDIDYSDFLTSNSNYFKNLTVTFSTYDKLTDHHRLMPYADFTDLNDYRNPDDPQSGGGYILPNTTELLYGLKSDVAITNGRTTYAKFDNMTPLTQNVTFVFDIVKKESRLAVHEVIGEISGVPNSITLLSNTMPYKHTFRSHFTVSERDMRQWDTFDNRYPLHIETTVPLLGIVRSANADMHVGPGILQLRLKTWVLDDNGRQVPGKTLRAGINLYNILQATPSVRLLDEERCQQTMRNLRLVIRVPLQITRDMVIPNEDDLDSWEWLDEVVVEM